MTVNQIRKLRLEKGLTQKQLAQAAGTSQQQIQRIEAGVQSARFDLAARICKALGEPMGRVFPSTALPLRRAGRRLQSPEQLIRDETALSELEQAGLDMDFGKQIFQYRLRGGAEGQLVLSGPEYRRLWSAIQGDEEDGFKLFDAGSRRFALNLKHLTFCHFLFEMPDQAGDAADEEKENAYEVRVFLADAPEPLTFDVDPDTASLDEEEDPEPSTVQLQDLLYYAEMGGETRLKLTDQDGETAWFRTEDVAMISVPLEAVVPKLLQTADEEEQEDTVESSRGAPKS